MVEGFSTTCSTVSITTKVVSSNSVHGEVYSIQHYVIMFVIEFATDRWFSMVSMGSPVSAINKTDRHDITEILLKVALITINHNLILLNNMNINILLLMNNR